MQAESTPAPAGTSSLPSIPVRNGTVVLTGYGVRVAVEHSQLEVSDGIGAQRRHGIFHRATSGLKRLVILGHTGSITFEALHWLHDIGAAVVQIDADGQVIVCSSPLGNDNAHLRRAQALAAGNDLGLQIVGDLIRAKLTGQARVLSTIGQEETAKHLEVAAETVEGATTTDEVRQIEAHGASRYWQSWADVSVKFARRDVPKVPPHWQAFGARTSPVSRSPRSAASPATVVYGQLRK